jgi:hypothetical protein
MSVKHLIIGAMLALGVTTAWANAEQVGKEFGVTVDKQVRETVADDEWAIQLIELARLGKATYRLTDSAGVEWTITVKPAGKGAGRGKGKATAADKHASTGVPDGAAFYAD